MEQMYLERNAELCRALESGEYTQGRRFLHQVGPDRWCCLGVAADVADRDPDFDITRNFFGDTEYFGGRSTLPPQSVADYYGWDNCNPALTGDDGEPCAAAVLNDSGDYTVPYAYTFPQIAAAFRRTFGIPAGSAAAEPSEEEQS